MIRPGWVGAMMLTLALLTGAAGATEPLPDTVEAFDAVFTAWMRRHGIERGAVSVARDDRLVLVRGHGGRRGDERTLVASLSKAITAACVSTLVQRGRLSYTTPLGDVLDRSFGEPADPRTREITIEQLLTHRAGFGDGHGRDPATGDTLRGLLRQRGPHATDAGELWRRVIRHRLQTAPGERYRYTNAAYLALGLVIAAVTAQPYEDYCAAAVLAPAGIIDARLDRTWRVLGAFGGWRLSGPEYLAFLRVFRPDGPVLDVESRRWLVATAGREIDATGQIAYTLGVMVRPTSDGHNVFHTGSWEYNLAGAPGGPLRASLATLAVRSAQGVSWFASFEPRPAAAARQELDRELWRAARAVRAWPADDQFARFGIR